MVFLTTEKIIWMKKALVIFFQKGKLVSVEKLGNTFQNVKLKQVTKTAQPPAVSLPLFSPLKLVNQSSRTLSEVTVPEEKGKQLAVAEE